MHTVLVALVALAGGIAISFQSLFSGVIGERVGILGSVFIVHAGGLLLSGVLLLVRGGDLVGWRNIPWHALTAGFIGVVIVASVSYAVPRLGLASTLTLAIAAQLIVGAMLDHFGLLGAPLRPLGISRLIGMAVLFLGTWLVVR